MVGGEFSPATVLRPAALQCERKRFHAAYAIVRGKDDSAKAIINDNKPLAVALLGAEVEETVTARQPTSDLDIIVDRIERSEWEVGEAIVPGASTSVDGVELAPYLVWRGHAVDPRRASQGEAAEILCAIIETKGPLSGNAMGGNGNCIWGQ